MQTGQNKRSWSARWLSQLACIFVLGCGSSATPSSTSTRDPQAIIADVLARYQSATAYSDNGEAVLRVRNDQGTQTQTAPLRVRWSHGILRAEAYALTLVTQPVDHSIELRAWFEEPETSHFDRQVLTQTISSSQSRLPLDGILADEILRSRLSAGLAGPPPQLEWLFAPQPMFGLFESTSQFERLEDGNLDGQNMYRIEVRRGEDRYLFWIDPREQLIRRVELPVPEHVMTTFGVTRSGATLLLDLHDASWTPSSRPPDHAQPSFDPRHVSRLIPMPPPPPSPVIGRTIPMGWLARLNLSNSARPAAVLVIHCPDDPQQIATLVPGLMPYADPSNPRAQLVMASKSESAVQWIRSTLGDQLPVASDNDLHQLLRDLRCPAGAMVLLDGEGQVLLLESQINPATLANIGAAIADDQAGVNVPQRIMRDYKQLTVDYQDALDSVSMNPNVPDE